MAENQLYDLLSRYMEGTIHKEEEDALKLLVNITDDNELSFYLHRLWDEHKMPKDFPQETTKLIFKQIKKQTSQQKRQLIRYKIMRIAAIFLFPLLSASAVYLFMNRTNQDHLNHEMTVYAPKGKQAGVTLPDGTNIQLNAESSLTYKQNYGLNERITELQGEGYFEVAKNKDIPFKVRTKELEIEVLGTTFNIYSYEDENITELSLLTGEVKVSTIATPVRTVILKPNEKAIFNKSVNSLDVKETNNRFETAWLKGNLVFRSTPLKEVITKLERKYDISIHLDNPEIENDLFTGALNCENITDAMKILQAHYHFEYKLSGENIYITSIRKK